MGNVGVALSRPAVARAYKFSQPGAPPAEIYASISVVTMLPRAWGWRAAGRQWQGVWGTRHDITAFLRHEEIFPGRGRGSTSPSLPPTSPRSGTPREPFAGRRKFQMLIELNSELVSLGFVPRGSGRAGRSPAPSGAGTSREGGFGAHPGSRGERPPAAGRAVGAAGPGGPWAVGGSIVKCLRGCVCGEGVVVVGGWPSPGVGWAARRDPPSPPSAGTRPRRGSALQPLAPSCVGHPLVVAVASPCPTRPVSGFNSKPEITYRLLPGPGLKRP